MVKGVLREDTEERLCRRQNNRQREIPRTTETGRPRIQKYELQLILVPDVNNLGHVDLFVKPKR